MEIEMYYLFVEKPGMQVPDLKKQKETGDTTKTYVVPVGYHKMKVVPGPNGGAPWIVFEDSEEAEVRGASMATWEQLTQWGIWGAKFFDSDQPGAKEILIRWRPTPAQAEEKKEEVRQ